MKTDINTIQKIELELSSYCNASCPLCSRNFYGYNYKRPSFELKHLSLDEIKKIFDCNIIKSVKLILLQGNFGDFAMNPETPDIVDYLQKLNPDITVVGHTNGGVQNHAWWSRFGKTTIYFALDGKDQQTHELYRKDTRYDRIIENAKAVRDAGGTVFWKMIEFDHNRNQIDICRQLAKNLGFKFSLISNSKSSGPVFNQQKIFLHDIGNWKGSRHLDKMINDELIIDDLTVDEPNTNSINCLHLKESSIYISSMGEVFPCCFMGHAPGRWNHGRWIEIANDQLLPLLQDHNCLEYGLSQSIKWFDKIPPTWEIKKFSQGRLSYCQNNCSSNS